MTTFSETTLPALIFSVPAGHPKGDVPALGRLTVNEAQAQSQGWVVWGCETNDYYTHTDSTGSGALFYEAEGRTALTGSTVVTLSGSSGGGTNNAVESIALPPVWTQILSTQATGAGSHLTHVGQFRVFARVMNTAAASGSVSVRLDWGVGDLAYFTSNDPVTLVSTVASTFSLVDLGVVTVPAVKTGTQRWEGRISATATANDKLRVDCLLLVPVDIGSGEAAALADSTSTLSIYDSFAQTAGNLTGKVTAVGAATWTFVAGDTDDWTLDTTNQWAVRAVSADTARRVIKAGTATQTTVLASVDVQYNDALVSVGGLILRLVDANNYLRIGFDRSVNKIIVTPFISGADAAGLTSLTQATPVSGSWYTMTASIDTFGNLKVWWSAQGGSLGTPVINFPFTSLATGGALASGSAGIWDLSTTSTGNRRMDNFTVLTPGLSDAAMYASQSLEIRHDGVQREDSTGAIWQPVGSYEGDLLKVPVTGREGRTVRFVVKASRNVPGRGPDAGIDDINATLALTPRYLSVPAPS